MNSELSASQAEAFWRDGYVLLTGYYDLATEIRPIQTAIGEIIRLVAKHHGVALPVCSGNPEDFDAGYAELIGRDRALGGLIYDAVKQIPAFVRLVSSERHERVFRELRGTDLSGVAAGGYGIRIDNPGEERFRADWHQEYPAQLRSLDGLVFWSPLVPVVEAMGPIRICVGSHREGLAPVHAHDPSNPDKTGAYALILSDRETRVARFRQDAPLAAPGDLVIMDFLTIHASGHNHGKRSRWSMQSRLFNFRDATGVRIGWRGSFAAGQDFRAIHPELVADPK